MTIRSRRGHVQTAIHTYRNFHGKTITLIGTIHIGDHEYFTELQLHIALLELQGAAVHYESIRRAPDTEPMTDRERDALTRWRSVSQLKLLADLLGVTTQLDIPIKPTWVNTDVTDLETLRAHDDHAFVDLAAKIAAQLEDAGDDGRAAFAKIMHWFLRHPRIMRTVSALRSTPKGGLKHSWVIDHRNRIAADAAIASPGDVVAIWGAGHLPGIGRLLHAADYERTNTQWVTAMRIGRHRALAVVPNDPTCQETP